MDSVLNNLNSLNRSIESSVQVGKEFKSVSNLWSNFYDGLNQVEELRLRNQQENEDGDEEVDNEEQLQKSQDTATEEIQEGDHILKKQKDSNKEYVEMEG
jgi:DASH complex subunit DAD1